MAGVVRVSLDFEFNSETIQKYVEDARYLLGGADLISAGMVCIDLQDFPHFYGVNTGFHREAAEEHVFVAEHVLPKLGMRKDTPFLTEGDLDALREGVLAYLMALKAEYPDADELEVWAKNGSQDNTLLWGLFGGLNRLYDAMNAIGFNKTRFKDMDNLDYPSGMRPPRRDPSGQHNAADDAIGQAETIQWFEENTYRPSCGAFVSFDPANPYPVKFRI